MATTKQLVNNPDLERSLAIERFGSIAKFLHTKLDNLHKKKTLYRRSFIILNTVILTCNVLTIGAFAFVLGLLVQNDLVFDDLTLPILVLSAVLAITGIIVYFTIFLTRNRFKWKRYEVAINVLQTIYAEYGNNKLNPYEDYKLKERINQVITWLEKNAVKKVSIKNLLLEFFTGGM